MTFLQGISNEASPSCICDVSAASAPRRCAPVQMNVKPMIAATSAATKFRCQTDATSPADEE